MDLREALRMLRSELGMTQSEFANAVHVGYTAESRWENKNTRPNRASSIAILNLAKKRCVSPVCLDGLTELLLASRANDKSDKELTAQVTKRMKLEERILLTNDKIKTMLDNIDIAVIGHRIYSSSPDETTVIFSNRKHAEMFGYSTEEFDEKSKKNIYFSIPSESRKQFEALVKRLLADEIQITDFSQVIRGFQRDGTTIWLEIKGISLERFSYGWDFFISCRDISMRIAAERKYAEEIAVRDASLRGFFASMHFDLVTNIVFRQKDIEKVTAKKFSGQSADKMLGLLAEGIHADHRKAFLDKFNREYLTSAFAEKNTFDNVTCFNTACGKWMRFDYVLIENPYTHHFEAVIYIYDVHVQTLAAKTIDIIGSRNFDCIGILNNLNGTYESLYCSPTALKHVVNGEKSYREICEKELEMCTSEHLRETQRKSICLENVRKMLNQSTLFTAEFRLDEHDNALATKVTYRYLDETKTSIVMALHKQNTTIESDLF